MNINQFTPKSVVLADVKAAAVQYKGTFEELNQLVNEDKITLITDENGQVNGIWVESGTGDMMVDEISGENFSHAYGYRAMTWLETILAVRASGRTIMYAGTETFTDSNGNIFNLDGTPYVESEDEPEEEDAPEGDEYLPGSLEIPLTDLNCEVTRKNVAAYLRYTYGHCLAKGFISELYIDASYPDKVWVHNINWGRALTESERNGWKNYLETGEYQPE